MRRIASPFPIPTTSAQMEASQQSTKLIRKLRRSFLPRIEIDSSLFPRLSRMRWLGLGPIDTYPNESAAGIFGVWSADKGVADANGLKTTRWLEMEDPSHTVGTLRIENSPYVRCDTDTLRVVAAEEGRVMKNRLPEKPEQRLDVTPGRKFHGAFTMRLLPNKH